MLIKARLNGHDFDLLTLAELFGEGDPTVATDDEGYYLRFTAPDELFRDGGGLHDATSVLLRRINGVAPTLSSNVRPVGLTGRFSDESGRHHQVVLADSAEVRSRANPVRMSVGGAQPPMPSWNPMEGSDRPTDQAPLPCRWRMGNPLPDPPGRSILIDVMRPFG